jgi:DNA-binding response OmpR family regulator
MMCWSISSPPQARYRLLYVGADVGLSGFVQEALKGEGWFVVRCPGGSVAEVLLRCGIHYDLLMFDEELKGGSGSEMVRLARSLEQRKRTPVILLSRKAGGGKARQAGGRVFVQRPQPFQAVLEAIKVQSSKFKVQGR